MAAIDYDTLFTRLGSIGHVGFKLAGYQSLVPADLDSVIAQYTGTPDNDLVGNLLTIAPSVPGPVVTPVQTISSIAITTLVRMVNASVPSITTMPDAMSELVRQMLRDGQSVLAFNLALTSTPLFTSVGNGVLVLSTKRGDGLFIENMIPEFPRITCIQDSYTGGATAGQEPFNLVGEPNAVSVWNYNYPQGSNANKTSSAISSSQAVTTAGNILGNSDFEGWSNATPTGSLNNWVLEVGTWVLT